MGKLASKANPAEDRRSGFQFHWQSEVIPLEEKSTAGAEEIRQVVRTGWQDLRVLVVDESIVQLANIHRYLEAWGMQVGEANGR